MWRLKDLRLRFRPPRLDDPAFGMLRYMHIPPTRSYWEGEWLFRPTGTKVAIGLPGTPEGPAEQGRAFYLALPAKFEQVVEQVRPVLDGVFREWIGRPLNPDLWQEVKLGGFNVEDPSVAPTQWDVGFETTGDKWLGITIPFVGDQPQDPVVET